MSGKYYWVKTNEGKEIEIGYQRKSGQWELCGIDVLRDINPIITEVICEVRKCSDENTTLPLRGSIKWVSIQEKLPPRPDEDYLVVVRNKNKEDGIPLVDIGNFSSDGIWIKTNTWEDVVYWAELPEPPR